MTIKNFSRNIEHMHEYFSGEVLRGANFTTEQEIQWYAEEAQAYGNLGYSDSSVTPRAYPYHALNTVNGFSYLPMITFDLVLGLGSAHGEEFFPIIDRVNRIMVVESDNRYYKESIFEVPSRYAPPGDRGELPVDSNSCDLVTCFGVLHHVCRPATAIQEIGRVLKPGGYTIIREPVISMGDWRYPRPGLTPNERGIPRRLIESYLLDSGFELVQCGFAVHRLLSAIGSMARLDIHQYKLAVVLDQWLCRPYRNVRYHRERAYQKFSPTSCFYVARKP